MSLDLSKLRTALENERCSVHKKSARIKIKGGKLYTPNCCCQEFRDKLNATFKKARDKQQKVDGVKEQADKKGEGSDRNSNNAKPDFERNSFGKKIIYFLNLVVLFLTLFFL